jgi:hypothetical protein
MSNSQFAPLSYALHFLIIHLFRYIIKHRQTPCTFSQFPIGFWSSVVGLGLLVVSIFIKLLFEWHTESQTHPSGSGQQNNTQARNKALTTMGKFSLFGFLAVLAPSPFVVQRLLKVDYTIIVFFAGECFFQVWTAFVMPLVFYLLCEDMRHYFKREFWDNAPECLQIYNADRVIVTPSPAQASQSHPQPAQASLNKPEPARASSGQPEQAQASPSQPKPAQTSPNQPKPAQDSPRQLKPAQASPSQPKPTQARQSQTKPDQAKQSQTKPDQVSPSQPKTAQASLSQTKPVHARSIQPKPERIIEINI